MYNTNSIKNKHYIIKVLKLKIKLINRLHKQMFLTFRGKHSGEMLGCILVIIYEHIQLFYLYLLLSRYSHDLYKLIFKFELKPIVLKFVMYLYFFYLMFITFLSSYESILPGVECYTFKKYSFVFTNYELRNALWSHIVYLLQYVLSLNIYCSKKSTSKKKKAKAFLFLFWRFFVMLYDLFFLCYKHKNYTEFDSLIYVLREISEFLLILYKL